MNKTIKVILVGDSSVGKTSLIEQYTKQKFEEDRIGTIGLDFASKKYVTKNDK